MTRVTKSVAEELLNSLEKYLADNVSVEGCNNYKYGKWSKKCKITENGFPKVFEDNGISCEHCKPSSDYRNLICSGLGPEGNFGDYLQAALRIFKDLNGLKKPLYYTWKKRKSTYSFEIKMKSFDSANEYYV